MAESKSVSSSLAGRTRSVPVGAFVTLEKLDRGGSLQARRLASGGVQFYWRYSHEGHTYCEPVGAYDPSAPPKKLDETSRGFSQAAARERCRNLAQQHAQRAASGGLREVKADERRRFEQRRAEQALKSSKTLKHLLKDYVDHLREQGRRSSNEAQGIFRLHVLGAWPSIATMPAADISTDQVLDMLRRLIEQGKGRTANKLRSYIRAAYQCALDVKVSAAIPLVFKAYSVTVNPAGQTKRDPRYDLADKLPLSRDELRRYWCFIRNLEGLRGLCLRLHLLTGGQRIDQLARLRWSDVAPDAITILDTKGRPGQGARSHTVPLLPEMARELNACLRLGEYVLSSTDGKKPIAGTTLSGWAKEVVGEAITAFQLKRVRSGVETLLAANGVSREVRGHLQSHGLSGIQARHYDGHDYMPEKRRALQILLGELQAKQKQAR